MQPRKITLVAALLSTVVAVPLAAEAQVVGTGTDALCEVPATVLKPVSEIQEAGKADHVVTGFKFVGSEAIAAADLQKILVSKVGQPLNLGNVEADKTALKKAYVDKGVTVDVQFLNQDDAGLITYIIVEKPLVSGFKFSGNTAFEADDLRQVIVSKIGATINVENIAADVAALLKMYSDKGMVAQVESATQDEKGVISFTLLEAKISQIKLSELVNADEFKVRVLITSQANELFQATKINADLQRCADTGLFEDVTYTVEEDPDVKGGTTLTFVFKEKEANQ